MSEFIFYYESNIFKMKFALDSTILELKQVISQRFNLSNLDNFHIYLEKIGFLDINSSSLNSPLSTLNSYLSQLTPPYHIFCFDITSPEKNLNFCTQKLTQVTDDISQIGINLKSDNLMTCLSCAKFCHNINADYLPPKELITDKKFKCQCNKCLFNNFNLNDINFGNNSKDEFIKKIMDDLNKKRNDLDEFKKRQKMIELNQKILKRDFEFEYIINLLEPRIICYRNPELQEKIKKIIPQRTEGLTSEQYVKILLKWFKKDYFSWCNKPKCPKCGQNDKNLTVITYKGTPNEQEKKYLAYKTEVYKCNQCQIEIRFARCNNPIILLETKTGRCSEWSNLFGAILYTCGFKVRLINNFEDHVWNEFYNEEEQRWIHLDSCEEAYDTPLVYEQGWGRVMTFILGMSDDGLVEVTPRYVKDWKIVSERRSEKMVIKLGNILEKWNQKWSGGFTNEQKKNIENRRKSEIENFEKKIKNDLNDNKIKDDEKIGRQSGSLEWRKNRGEC